MTGQSHRQTHELTIIGFGIAGATLAWQLHRRGVRLRIIDIEAPGAASRVAAGLVTPITGKKLKPQPDFVTLRQSAAALYQRIQAHTESRFWFERAALRVLTTQRELDAWAATNATRDALAHEDLGGDWHGLPNAGKRIRMPMAARLDTRMFLDASRRFFAQHHRFDERWVTESAGPTVWCCGFNESRSKRIPSLPWRPAKGEILTIVSRDLTLRGTLHANGIWVTPVANQQFLAGATYSWDELDGEVTTEAANQLKSKISDTISAPFEIVRQQAGVRPIVSGRRPVIGCLPDQREHWIFNGLGSKGSLLAPTLAEALAQHIVSETSIPTAYDVAHRIEGS